MWVTITLVMLCIIAVLAIPSLARLVGAAVLILLALVAVVLASTAILAADLPPCNDQRTLAIVERFVPAGYRTPIAESPRELESKYPDRRECYVTVAVEGGHFVEVIYSIEWGRGSGGQVSST